MSYRLKFDEPVHKGWRRIVGEQIEAALALLETGTDVDAAIHETRKSMKRVRALLKLLRPGLSPSDYKREKKRYADIGRLLSGVRDRAVLAATATALSEQTTGKARVAAQALAKQANSGAAAADAGECGADAAGGRDAADPGIKAVLLDAAAHDTPDQVKAAIAALKQAAKSLKKLRLKSRSFDVVRAGLGKTYRAARSDMKLAYKSGVDEHFHEWRKSVQAHWRHMLLMERAWPDVFAARAQLAKEMSDLLGEDHDLYVLIQTLNAHTETGAVAAGRDALIRAARVRQDDIRRELAAKGQALFAEPANRFVSRVDDYWTAARAARKAGRHSGRKAKAPAHVVDRGSDGAARPAAKRGSQKAEVARPSGKEGPPVQAKSKREGSNGAGAGKAAGQSRAQVSAAKSRSEAKRSGVTGASAKKGPSGEPGKPRRRSRNGAAKGATRKGAGKA